MRRFRTAVSFVVLALLGACSIVAGDDVGRYPDAVAPRAQESILAELKVLLEAADASTNDVVYGAHIGDPSLHRALLASFVLRHTQPRSAVVEPAVRYIDEFTSDNSTYGIGDGELQFLRAALGLHPDLPNIISQVDVALERKLDAWILPSDEVDSLVDLVDVARLIEASVWGRDSLPRATIALRRKILSLPHCPSASGHIRGDELLWSAAALVGSFAYECSTASETPLDESITERITELNPMELIQLLRTAADYRALGSETMISGQIVQEIETRLSGHGGYALRAVLPLQAIASTVASAEDAGEILDIGERQRIFAYAVVVSNGRVPDLLGRGSVIDGILTRLALRWLGGPKQPTEGGLQGGLEPPSGLAIMASSLFVAAPARQNAMVSQPVGDPLADAAAETARRSLELLISARAGACDSELTEVLQRWLDVRHADPHLLGALATVDSGALAWAVLGMQALHECDFAQAVSHAAMLSGKIEPVSRIDVGQGDVGSLLRAWALTELACIQDVRRAEAARTALREAGLTANLSSLGSVLELSTTSATVGVGTVTYAALRLRRVAFDGCGPDLVEVLRAW